MDLARLRHFLAVVDSGTVSAAARAAGLTQPALSRNIQLLEEQLGAQLFERRGRRLVLNAAGRSLVDRARGLLGAADEVARAVARAATRAYFDLRLGAVDSVTTAVLPRLVPRLGRDFPELALKLSSARSTVLLDRVKSGALDLAVVAHSGPPAGLRHQRLAPYRLNYYGRSDRFPRLPSVRHASELHGFPIVEIDPTVSAGLAPNDALSYAVASNVATVKAMVLAGFGVGDFPDFMLDAGERRRLHQARLPHDPDCHLYLVGAEDFVGAGPARLESAVAAGLKRLVR